MWLPVYAGLLALHAPLLRLPYYWDEAGYFVPAALDFFRHGWLIPRSTLANGHPPLLSLCLSLAWWLAGFHPWVTRAAMLAWQATLVWGVYRLVELTGGGPRAAASRAAPVLAALLAALAPLCFAQGSLALLDLPVAALVVWALVWRARGKGWPAVACLCAAVLMKETAVIAAAALWLLDAARGWRRSHKLGRGFVAAAPLCLPALAIAGWFLYYHRVTGYWFGNPQYFAYNVGQAAGSLPRMALSFLRRLWQLAGYNGTWLLTLLAGAALWRRRSLVPSPSSPLVPSPSSLAPSPSSLAPSPSSLAPSPSSLSPLSSLLSLFSPPSDWLAIIAAYVLFHAAVGGAVLARYLLPALVLYFAWLALQIATLPRVWLWAALVSGFLVVCWFWNPPYPFPYEDNLAYARFVQLHQQAARFLESHAGAGPVWTAWPATDELERPALGYVTRPLSVRPLADFGRQALDGMNRHPRWLYLYSQIYEPRRNWAATLPIWRRWAIRYYRFDVPMPAAAWLQRLNLKAYFSRRSGGQWVLIAGPR